MNSSSPFDSIPKMRRVSPTNAAEIVSDFRRYPPPPEGGTGIFPFEASLVKGPAAMLPVLEVLIEQTTERGHKYTPYFTGPTKKQISKNFALGLVNVAKYQPLFPLWHPDPRYPPSARVQELQHRFDTDGRSSTEFSLQSIMTGASRVEVEMKCTLEDRNVPIPFWQNYSCHLLFLFKATLRTKPELLKTLTKAGAFQVVVDLVRNETDVTPSDLLQQQFCEFVGEFQEDKYVLKKLHEADVLKVLLSFATSPNHQVRTFSASLIDSIQSLTKQNTTAKNVRADSVQGVVDALMTCDKTDLTQQTMCSLINDMMKAEEDAKDQLCQPRNMIRMLKLIEESTESRESLTCQDEHSSQQKVVSGYSVSFWNAKALIHAVCNSLGGSAERQKLVADTCGKRLLARYVELLRWFADASPTDGFGDMNSILCDSFYKIIARTTEGRLVVNEVGAPLPLARWANRVLRLVLPGHRLGLAGLTPVQVKGLVSGQGIATALEAAKAAVVSHGEFVSLRQTSVGDMSTEMEKLVYENFQLAIDLLASPPLQSLLSFESVSVIIYLINATIFCYKISPEVSFLKRVIRYLQVRTTCSHDLPYLTILSDIESRNAKLSFSHQEYLMKEVDNSITAHHTVLRNFTNMYMSSRIKRELDTEERDTLEWVYSKVTAGTALNRLVASLGLGGEDDAPQEEETKIDVCNAIGCSNYANLKDCGACHQVAYCGKECQSKDWPRHKKACKEARKATLASSRSGDAQLNVARPPQAPEMPVPRRRLVANVQNAQNRAARPRMQNRAPRPAMPPRPREDEAVRMAGWDFTAVSVVTSIVALVLIGWALLYFSPVGAIVAARIPA